MLKTISAADLVALAEVGDENLKQCNKRIQVENRGEKKPV